MTEINSFDFSKYDVGGTDATASDGKLTGQEAQNARADGWTIWDGYSEEDLKQYGGPENVNHQQNSNTTQEGSLSDKLNGIKLPDWIKDLIIRQDNPVENEGFKIPGPVNIAELNEEALKKANEVKVNGIPISDYIADITGKNDDKLTAEQKEARAELNQKQSSIGMTYADAKAKVAEILQKYPECFDEIEISQEPQPGKNGFVPMIHREPTKIKLFNPDKLPEPAKTEYKEAVASMAEIENNNSALAQKGGINKTPISNPKIDTILPRLSDDGNSFGLDEFEFKDGHFVIKEKEPTETQKAARAKLNEKVSSTGMSYKDAKATIESITNKYKNNPDYQSEFEQEQDKTFKYYKPPIKAFDPYKLKGADKEVFFKALSAIHEIETANYALLTQAGLEPTPDPKLPKSKYENFMQK